MSSFSKARPFTCLALPLAVAALSAVASCRDSTPPGEATSGLWAQSAVVGLTVKSELTAIENHRSVIVGSASSRVNMPVLTGFGAKMPSISDKGQAKAGRRTVIRHFRDRSGTTTSIGLYFEQSGTPPKLIYIFENGRIQTIVSPVYERYGQGYVRTKVRVTMFKDGTPVAQINQAAVRTAAAAAPVGRLGTMAARAVLDVARTFLPRPLYAEEAGLCIPEWVSYFAASTALAAANAVLIAASAACPLTAGTACPTTLAAFVAWTGALAAWTDKLDKLTTCIEKSSPDNAGVTAGSDGGGSQSGSDPDWGNDDEPETMTVEDFIDDSISKGNFSCSDDGNYCIYYAD